MDDLLTDFSSDDQKPTETSVDLRLKTQRPYNNSSLILALINTPAAACKLVSKIQQNSLNFHTPTHTHIHQHTPTHTPIPTHTYTYTHLHTHTHTHTHNYIYMCISYM